MRSLSTLSVGGGVSARCIQNAQAQEEPMCPLVQWPEEGSPPGKKRAEAKPRDKLVPEQAECFRKGPGTDVLSLASGITHTERPEIGWRRDSDGGGRKEPGWNARTKGNRAFLVLRPHRRQGGKEHASSADTKLGSERKECAQGDGPDGGGTRDNHSGEGTAKAHLFNAKASLLEARRPAAPQSPECLLELP